MPPICTLTPAITPTTVNAASTSLPAARETPATKTLAGVAFALLAAGVCVRPLFQELWTVAVPQLARPADVLVGLQPRDHVPGAPDGCGGRFALAAVWVVLGRRHWRFSGLEIGAAVLILPALLSLHNASDKRVGNQHGDRHDPATDYRRHAASVTRLPCMVEASPAGSPGGHGRRQRLERHGPSISGKRTRPCATINIRRPPSGRR